ncbi:helix-turn-helix domain-containing protein [Kushneria aurantia]|uniref:Helix-turn-helix domain-containing protein n=1 Tax=Kushneria aurantia TaxID=504092 RepID=A0ABV6FZC7_9GAMM|nr:hypothetical protein [Kushneria aurantia]
MADMNEADDFEDVDDWTREERLRPLDAAAMLKVARGDLQLSQQAMAQLMQVSLKSLRNWEQRRTQPEKAARVLIQMLYKRPQQARELLEEVVA